MARVTIECPDCHRELSVPLNAERVHRGGFNCECGNIIQFEVIYSGAWWARHTSQRKEGNPHD
jgi:hypothetical protein